jgi:hypothetical protein
MPKPGEVLKFDPSPVRIIIFQDYNTWETTAIANQPVELLLTECGTESTDPKYIQNIWGGDREIRDIVEPQMPDGFTDMWNNATLLLKTNEKAELESNINDLKHGMMEKEHKLKELQSELLLKFGEL